MMVKGYQRFGVFASIITLVCAAVFAIGQARANERLVTQMTQPKNQDLWDPIWLNRSVWDRNQNDDTLSRRRARHLNFLERGVPVEYGEANNPLSGSAVAIAAGRALYEDHCQSCHGANGTGDGNAANDLSPSPALLSFMISMPMSVDAYLMWSISEGGVAFGSEMPAFRSELTNDEIWEIVSFMRAGFPQ